MAVLQFGTDATAADAPPGDASYWVAADPDEPACFARLRLEKAW